MPDNDKPDFGTEWGKATKPTAVIPGPGSAPGGTVPPDRAKAIAEERRKADAERKAATMRKATGQPEPTAPAATAPAAASAGGQTIGDLYNAFFGTDTATDWDDPVNGVMGFSATFQWPPFNQFDQTATLIPAGVAGPEAIAQARTKAKELISERLSNDKGMISATLAMMIPTAYLNEDVVKTLDFRPLISQLIAIRQAMGKDVKNATVLVDGVLVPIMNLDEKAMVKELEQANTAAADNARIIATEEFGYTGQDVETYVAEARDAYALDPSRVGKWLTPDDPDVQAVAAASQANVAQGKDGYTSWVDSADPITAATSGIASANPNWTIEGLRMLANTGQDIWQDIKAREETYGQNRATFAQAGQTAPAQFDPLEVGFNSFGFSNLPDWAVNKGQAVQESGLGVAFGATTGQNEQTAPGSAKTKVRIFDAVDLWSKGTASPAEIKAVRDRLVAGGYLGETGLTWDSKAQTAWRALLQDSLLEQKQPEDVLMERAANMRAQSRQVSDPAQLRYQVSDLARTILGRDLSTGEFNALRQYIIDLEKRQDVAKTELNGEWFAVNEQNSAGDYLRRQFSTEARQVSDFNEISDMAAATGQKFKIPKLTQEQREDVMRTAHANDWTSDRMQQYIIEKYVMDWEA